MDAQAYSRLQEEYQKEIRSIEERIKQWETFTSDYEAVQERLATLPKKLTHDIMVPISSNLAFMPGELYHTNEVLVLLGDNWFQQCTAHHAWGVAERRKKYTSERLESEKQLLEELTAKSSFTSDIQGLAESGYKEIREDFDQQKELEWKRAHKLRLKEERVKNKRKENVPTHDDVWARLNELEEEEDMGGVGVVSKDRENPLSVGDSTTIRFKHSRPENEDWKENEDGASDGSLIKSPRDIYKHYREHISLASTSSSHLTVTEGEEEGKQRRSVRWAQDIDDGGRGDKKTHQLDKVVKRPKEQSEQSFPTFTQPFSGQVIERTSKQTVDIFKLDPAAEAVVPKRVSRFKAGKLKPTL